jgi:hypothetical protein
MGGVIFTDVWICYLTRNYSKKQLMEYTDSLEI